MTTYLCTEPMSDQEQEGNWVQVAGTLDTIVFPGVDSCLAVIYFLANGGMVGGHVGIMWPGERFPSPRNANKLLHAMTGQLIARSNDRVDKIIFIGDIENNAMENDWQIEDLQRVCKTTLDGNRQFVTLNKSTGSITIVCNGAARRLEIYRNTQDLSRQVYSEAFNTVAGDRRLPD